MRPYDPLSSKGRQRTVSGEIVGKSANGRTTVYVLDMNDPRRVELRAAIIGLD